MNKKLILFLLILISINLTYAQSIGSAPKNTINVKTHTPTITDFGISQGSDYAERITITGNYDWLTIEERDFTLESKSGKTIKININVKKPGTHKATFRICGSPITAEGAMLSTKACTSHNLTVIATLHTKIIVAAIILFILIIASLLYLFKSFKNKHNKKTNSRNKKPNTKKIKSTTNKMSNTKKKKSKKY